MVKKFLRKRSKRMPAKRRYKIEKKMRDHQKKKKKESKKKAIRAGGFRKEHIVVPAEAPFKAQVLEEAAEAKRQEEELRRLRKEEAKQERLMAAVQAQEVESEEIPQLVPAEPAPPTETLATQTTRRAASRDFQAVVRTADVILQVLDARDPIGTRSAELESHVALSGSKRMVLVLNKADLVPSNVLSDWLRYLRRELPAVAFKSSTQKQQHRLAQRRGGAGLDVKKSTSACVGANTLLALLGNYSRKEEIRGSITVGVVGMPNVGKSSVINSLKRSRVCNVGATAGVTRHMQTVQLDSKVRLLDSPGIVFACGPAGDAQVALLNAMRLEQLADPIAPAAAILQRVSSKELQMHYNIGSFKTAHEFLCLLSRRQGRLKKKGVPNVDAAARALLQDWTGGRIKYYTLPPEESSAEVESSVVSTMAAEFDINAVSDVEAKDMRSLIPPKPSQTMVAKNVTAVEAQMEEDGASDTVPKDVDNEPELLPATLRLEPSTSGRLKRKRKADDDGRSKEDEEPTRRALNKEKKMQFKRARKLRKKQEKEMAYLSEKMDAAFDSITAVEDE